jgi:regulator of PEP synthase PpsR (kinase-PPPase family)
MRQVRARLMRLSKGAYSELIGIYEELEQAAAVHRQLGCPVVDVSELSIEETAQRVLRLVERRKSAAAAG